MFFNLGLPSKNSTHAGQPTAMKQKKRKLRKKHEDQMQYSGNVSQAKPAVGSISDGFFLHPTYPWCLIGSF